MRGSTSSRLLFVDDVDEPDEALAQAVPTVKTIPKPDELGWWDWAVFLLHTAAEIEHVLMVEYLYAAYSLADSGFTGTAVPVDAATRTATWRATITGIAREEMAHLLTEQNLLRFIDGPHNFEREDFPFRSALYPFPLSLEPLNRTSLAKYIAAEMPADPAVPDIEEITARATLGAGGMTPNRVGIVFDTLIDIFSDPTKLTDADLRNQTATTLQAASNDWFGFFPGLIIMTISSRDEAVAALRAVGEQGEGSDTMPPGAPPAHFDRFLQIYREFPETESANEPEWLPTRHVPVNPTTAAQAAADPAVEESRITHPVTRLWAQLFNVRYRMILVDLAHALEVDGPLVDDNGVPTPRGNVRDWAFQQMRGEGLSGMRGIAEILTSRPRKPDAAATGCAGPPFELPYTFATPDTEHGRWRLQLALLDASAGLVTRLRGAGETGTVLDELESIDASARTIVQQQLAAH